MFQTSSTDGPQAKSIIILGRLRRIAVYRSGSGHSTDCHVATSCWFGLFVIASKWEREQVRLCISAPSVGMVTGEISQIITNAPCSRKLQSRRDERRRRRRGEGREGGIAPSSVPAPRVRDELD